MANNSYDNAFNKYGESPQALQWNSYKSIGIRYQELVASLDIKGKTVLDAGCGMGDLIPFLYAKAGADFRYLGVDRKRDFIKIAQRRYWGHEFKVADVFSHRFKKKFDVVISSGVMNHDGPDWFEQRQEMIAKLFSLANETLAFNMAGWHGEPEQSRGIAYANIDDVVAFCRTLTSKVRVSDQYLDNDFTLVISK